LLGLAIQRIIKVILMYIAAKCVEKCILGSLKCYTNEIDAGFPINNLHYGCTSIISRCLNKFNCIHYSFMFISVNALWPLKYYLFLNDHPG
jgi:hypothetical protein